MASYWIWALAMGGIITVGGATASRLAGDRQAPPPRFSVLSIGLGALLPIIAFVLCLPASHPFARGTAMGYGALLGLGSAVIVTVVLRVAKVDGRPAAGVAALASLGGVAILWVATTQLVFAGDPVYGLYGGLAGALLALLPLWWGVRLARDTTTAAALEFFGLAIVVQGLGALLAIARYDSALLRPYWGLPVLALAGGLLGAVVAVLAVGRAWSARSAAASALFIIVIGFGAWLGGEALLAPGHKPIFLFDRHLYRLLLAGWVGFALLAAQIGAGLDRWGSRLVTPLLGVALLVVAFNLAGGYGVSLALSAGLTLALPFWSLREEREGGPAFLWLGVLGVLFMGYRLFLAGFGYQFSAGSVLDLGRHYVFVGLAAGLLWAAAAREARLTFAAVTLQCIALAVLPAILFVVFSIQGLLGLILGLWVSQLLLPTIEERRWTPAGVTSLFFPLVAAWALIIPRWGDFMLDLPRWIRGVIIGVAIAAAIVALGILRERGRPAANEAPADLEQ